MMDVISAIVLLGSSDPATVSSSFKALGFKTEVVSPRGLVIMGDEALFEDRFGVALRVDDTGIWVTKEGEDATRVLPKATLPMELRRQVEAVEFEAPIDFGPVSY